MVCPVRRAVATMLLALPLRPGGALDINAFRFGAWKKPNPAPQMAIRQTMSAIPGVAGSVASSTIPTVSNANPMPPSRPTLWRSDKRPAIGAMNATTSGHGVIKKPVSTWDRCKMSSK